MHGTTALYAPRTRSRFARVVLLAAALLVVALLAPATASAQSSGTRTARANLNAVPSPGGNTGVSGQINFSDDGNLLSFSGTAAGMASLSQYVSLVYGRNSNANLTSTAPPPCADDGTLGAPAEATLRMFLGEWFPVVGTTRSLVGTNALVGLEEINTTSIRRVNIPVFNPNMLLTGGDIRPQTFQLQACGLIVRNR